MRTTRLTPELSAARTRGTVTVKGIRRVGVALCDSGQSKLPVGDHQLDAVAAGLLTQSASPGPVGTGTTPMRYF